MLGKAALLVGLATGYVLGARDGRERYEQIKAQATKLKNDPRVQQKTAQAADLAKEKAPILKDVAAKGGSADLSATSPSSSSTPSSTSRTADSGAAVGSPVGALDEDVIIVTPPPPAPSPLDTPSQGTGELHG